MPRGGNNRNGLLSFSQLFDDGDEFQQKYVPSGE